MKITDLSLTIEEGMMTFPTHWHRWSRSPSSGDTGWKGARREAGAGDARGTHADAPLHFIPQGKGIDQVPLDVLVGRREC